MLAAVYWGRRDVRVQEWPHPPAPSAGWLTVKVSCCGICGTDLEEYLHGPSLLPAAEPHPVTGARVPLVLGHEGAGTVVAAGAGARIGEGARVGLENTVSCGRCAFCRSGDAQLCRRVAVIGLGLDGALAEYVNVPEGMCAPLPAGLGDEAGAIAEPLSVAVRAVRRAGGVRAREVGVYGGGTIGLLVAQVAKADGAASVVVYEPRAGRRERAGRCGIEALGPSDRREGAEVVFECSGQRAGFEAAIAGTDVHGTTVVVSVHPDPVPIDLKALLFDERVVTSSLSHSFAHDYVPAIDLLASGAIVYEPLVTRIPLHDVVSEGLGALAGGADHLKVLVRCGGPE